MVGIIGLIIFLLGILLIVIAGIWGTILAFQEDIVWGLLYLFVPFAALVFIIKKWSKKAVRNSFFLSLLGILATVGGSVISSVGLSSFMERQEQFPIGSGDQPFPIGDSPDEDLPEDVPGSDPTTQPSPSSNEPAIAPEDQPESEPVPQTTEAPSTQSDPSGDYHDTMMLGYRAYGQGDYQTALINFRRALEMQPGDQLATEAIENTEAAIAAN